MAIVANNGSIKSKIISISPKRQLTIPGAFYSLLGFGDKAECEIRDNELVIRPARFESGGEFAEEILEELVAEGYSGQELIREFKIRQSKIRPAVEAMVDEARKFINDESSLASFSDVFGEEL